MAIIMRYNEPIVNQQNGSIINGVLKDWSRRIHSVNKVPRPNSPHCTYYHHIGHYINECPFIEENERQGFVEHFENLNPELAKVRNDGHIKPKDLYHERVKILDRFKKQVWKDNKVKMKVQIVVDVVPIAIVLVQSLLNQDNIGVTYVGTSNFRMELVTSMLLYYVKMH
jgi:hypothetical protein